MSSVETYRTHWGALRLTVSHLDSASCASSSPPITVFRFNGTLQAATQATPTYQLGKYGTAIALSGSSATARDPYISYDGSNATDLTKLDFVGTSFTGGAWVNFSSILSGTAQKVYLMERGSSLFSGTGNYFSFQLAKGERGDATPSS